MILCVLVCRLQFQLRTASRFATLSIRLRLMSAIHVGDCDLYLQFMLAIHISDSVLFFFFCIIIIITIWVNSADNKLIFFLIFPENRHNHFIQIVSWRDTLPEISNLVTGKIRKKHFKMSFAEFFSQSAKH